MTQHTDPSRAALLLLARLLLGKKPPTIKAVRKDLAALGVAVADDENWKRLISEAASKGLITESPWGLTAAGRETALTSLGLAELPPKTTWTQLRDKQIIAMALADDNGARPALTDLASKPKLTGLLLKRKFGLRVKGTPTVAQAATAVVCQTLGFPEISDLKTLQAAVISRILKSDLLLPEKSAIEQLVRVELSAPRGTPAEMRKTVLSSWLAAEAATTPNPAEARREAALAHNNEADVAKFAEAVQAAAQQATHGRFGENKVFISHVWKTYRSNHPGVPADLTAFKDRLIAANRAGLLRLSRADLVAAMDPTDVRDSEIRYLNAEFHFVLLERD